MSTSAARLVDVISTEYPYSWSPSAKLSIEGFVAKYKPSMVQNDGTKPWIWVRREEKVKSLSIENKAAATVEAAALLQQVAERVEQIKNGASIPMRGSKKKGTQSKREAREQVQAEAAAKLKDISKKYGFVVGKWLIFAPTDKVDAIWSKIASSLVSGPLSSTSAFSAKVATSPVDTAPGHQHVICIYIPDVYDKEDVTEVMKVLLRQHGLKLSGVKSDLYTVIGLDSKHASGIPSTVWKNVSLLKDSEIRELKEIYYNELSASKAVAGVTADLSKGPKPAQGKSKLIVKRKFTEDLFVSDNEIDPKSEKLVDTDGKRKIHEDGNGESGSRSSITRQKIM